ncbi:hypothetical protein EIP91_010540 [Steccherinum ochraceum]|uniref:Uncharacterized protein n=1 Tax=Steccherinum ochraceum TaxID=92696 RepID=A0A4R0R9D2_9APHY|nr:hypothetical protein EIP91_010540 [Steccherinum ochraceum]
MSAILRQLKGANLEVFKFAFYLAFPLGIMTYFGDYDWYAKHVTPYKSRIFPAYENTVQNLPHDPESLREELAKIKARKLQRIAEREAAERSERPAS